MMVATQTAERGCDCNGCKCAGLEIEEICEQLRQDQIRYAVANSSEADAIQKRNFARMDELETAARRLARRKITSARDLHRVVSGLQRYVEVALDADEDVPLRQILGRIREYSQLLTRS